MVVPRPLILLLLAGLAAACTDTSSAPDTTAATVEVTPVSATLVALGASQQFQAVARSADGLPLTGKTFTWTSADPDVATTSTSGMVTAASNGSTTITSTVDGVQGSAAVTVAQSVISVALTPDPIVLRALGDTARLIARADDARGNAVTEPAAAWQSADISIVTIDGAGLLTAVGDGSTTVTATIGGIAGSATVFVTTGAVVITVGPTVTRQGDVVTYVAERRDGSGALIEGATFAWSVVPSTAGAFGDSGRFVGYAPGSASILVESSALADTLPVTIQARGLGGSIDFVGQGAVTNRFTSDLWVRGNYAYTGTWGTRTTSAGTLPGNTLYVWDVSDPSAPSAVDSVQVDAVTVNDIKVHENGSLAVMTHEGSSDGMNGITLLDLADPAHPRIITRYTTGLEGGIHNVWIDGNYLYAAEDGSGSVRVVDISTPASPTLQTSFRVQSGFVHDVYVRDGLAFLSHWGAGVVIFDVGNGIVGGAPTAPVEVSRVALQGVEVHNAWYWPATGYIFLGDETQGGVMHVIDASDLTRPRKVADFRVAGAAPHNFWTDEANAIIYLAWYERGVRAVDVSGVLLGQLDRQGREIASSEYSTGSGGCAGTTATCTWAPQLHDGLVYVSDMNTGLWVLRPSF